MTARVAAGTARKRALTGRASSGVTRSIDQLHVVAVVRGVLAERLVERGREAAHDAQRRRAALHHVADLDLGLGDVRDDEQQRRVGGQPDVDLDVLVAPEDAVLLDRP